MAISQHWSVGFWLTLVAAAAAVAIAAFGVYTVVWFVSHSD